MLVPSVRSADAIFEELRARRTVGGVHVGVIDAAPLPAVATAFALRPATSTYRRIDREEAGRLLTRLLHRDLAYDAEIMPLADARRLAKELLALVPDAELFTNRSFGKAPGEAVLAWDPATDATFDTGVIALGPTRSLCVWVEDED